MLNSPAQASVEGEKKGKDPRGEYVVDVVAVIRWRRLKQDLRGARDPSSNASFVTERVTRPKSSDRLVPEWENPFTSQRLYGLGTGESATRGLDREVLVLLQ